MTRAMRAATALLLVLLASCGPSARDATQVIVVIDAEAAVRSQAATLELSVRGLSPDAGPPTTRALRGSADEIVLPYTLALVPLNGDDTRNFEVLVTARSETQLVARARVVSHYMPHRKLLLPVTLRADCIAVDCTGGLTCLAGQCQSAEVDPATLGTFAGDAPPTAHVSKPDAGTGGTPDDGGVTGDPCPSGQCPCVDGSTRFCDGTDTGACDRGTQTCVDSRWQDCVGHKGKSDEICNNVDDDCNGNVDDPDLAVCDPKDVPNSESAACVHGKCVPTSCAPLWADCNGSLENSETDVEQDGCERSLNTLTSCGGCDIPCTTEHAQPTCDSGACAIAACDDDWLNCDNNALDCETHVDANHCGACQAQCELDHATADCGGSVGARSCEVAQCDQDFDDCDGEDDNGCEVDVQTDNHNCGDCDNDCTTKPHADSGSCVAGACEIVCASNFVDCNGDPNDGCEVDLRVAPCPRCLDLASNVSAGQLNALNWNVAPAVNISCDVTFNWGTSPSFSPSNCCGTCPEVSPALSAQPSSSGAPLVVMRASSLNVAAGSTLKLTGNAPVLFVVRGNATISGVIDASAAADTAGAGGGTRCTNGSSQAMSGQVGVALTGNTISTGGGGGGHATPGGLGGPTPGQGGPARSGGFALSGSSLTPLSAGCGGGVGHSSPSCTQLAGAGGGALQLVVAGKLSFGSTAELRANGGDAPAAPIGCAASRTGGSGGGAGGAILLEAVVFQTDPLAKFLVNGGDGSASTNTTALVALGGTGSTSASAAGNAGGYVSPAGAGGGGGYGRVVSRSCLP